MTAIPRHAELLDLFEVVKTTRNPSRYAPTALAIVKWIACPACGRQHGEYHSDAAVDCDCGLRIRLDMLNAYIWRDEAASP